MHNEVGYSKRIYLIPPLVFLKENTGWPTEKDDFENYEIKIRSLLIENQRLLPKSPMKNTFIF